MSINHARKTPPVAVVINDDVNQLTFLVRLLEKAEIVARAFKSPTEMLAAIGSTPLPDLVITDLYMPGIDGWRFCRLLRSSEYPEFNNIPILVVSATFSGDEASTITSDLGANAFMASPVDRRLFIETVTSLLKGEKPGVRLRVLIVEDNNTLAHFLQDAFHKQGYHAEIAMDLASAASALKRRSFDIAVIDYHLPDGKGDFLLERCRKSAFGTVCIMMTTDPSPALALEWMQKGAAAYLRKPFEIGYLFELCTRARRERALMRVEEMLEERTRQLKNSEELFRTISENAFDLISVVDLEGCYVYCNQAHESIMGYPPQQLIGKSAFEMVHPDNREAAVQFFFEGIANQSTSRSMTFRSIRQDSAVRWVDCRARLLMDEAGRSDKILLIAQDVTERKLAREQLQRSTKYYRSLLDSTHDPLLVVNRERVVEYANKRLHKTMEALGLDAVVTGRHFKEAFPFLPEELMDEYRAVFNTGEPYVSEKAVFLNGTEYFVETTKSPLLDENGEVSNVITVIRDITRKKEMEESLKNLAQEQHLLLSNIDAQVWYLTDVDTYGAVNKAHAEFFKKSRKDLEHRKLSQVMTESVDVAAFIESNRLVFETKRPLRVREWIVNGNGERRLLLITKTPKLDDTGRVLFVVCSAHDVTERYRLHEALYENEKRLSLAQTFSRTGVWEYDIRTPALFWSKECEALFGLGEGEFEGTFDDFLKRVHVDDREYVAGMNAPVHQGKKVDSLAYEHRIVKKNGEVRWVRINAGMVYDESGKPARLTGFVMDITEKKSIEGKLERQFTEYETVFHGTRSAMFLIDVSDPAAFRFIRNNRIHQEATGITLEAIRGKTPEELLGKTIGKRVSVNYRKCIQNGRPLTYEEILALPKGEKIWQTTLTPVFNKKGEASYLVGSAEDITERKKAEEQLRRLATTDDLTGLWNRRHFINSVTQEFGRARRYKQPFSILTLDLDFFKQVNDTMGHSAGDGALRHIAAIIGKNHRPSDTPGRVGGEEFSILLPETDIDEASQIAERLRSNIENSPFLYNSRKIFLTASIGVASYNNKLDSVDDILLLADRALYEAKDKGRNRVVSKTCETTKTGEL